MNKTVYIASPYTKGDIAVNIRNSIFEAEKLVKYGFIPFTPLLTHFWHIISPHDYEYWMDMDLVWILKCDYLLRMSGESKGADREVEWAGQHNIPVYYSVDLLYMDVNNIKCPKCKTNEQCRVAGSMQTNYFHFTCYQCDTDYSYRNK